MRGAQSILASGALLAAMAAGARADEASTTEAIERGLAWLLRHRSVVRLPSVEGEFLIWRADSFIDECETPCRNEDPALGKGVGLPAYDIGVTGLAMLALTRSCNTKSGPEALKHLDAIESTANFLMALQDRSDDLTRRGAYGPIDRGNTIYNHAIATLAMSEYARSATSEARTRVLESLRLAARLCLYAQNEGYGWYYGVKPGKSSSSVTGWVVLALASAAAHESLGIDRKEIDAAFGGALNWFDRATSQASGKTGYIIPGDPGARVVGAPEPYPYSEDMSEMTALAVACRFAASSDSDVRAEETVKRGIDLLVRELPAWRTHQGVRLSTVNFYYWFWGTHALRAFGGALEAAWSEALIDALVGHQRRSGDEDGSWDPIGEWGSAGGRVCSTALATLTLQLTVAQSGATTGAASPAPLEYPGFSSLGRNAAGFLEYVHDATGLAFVALPGGTFTMGSPESEAGRSEGEIEHEVELSPFLVSKHEVSQKAWKSIMGDNPSRWKGDDLPVEGVSWADCQRFCRRAELDLPTEAQWEYACRAGAATPFTFGPSLTTAQANFDGTKPYAGAEDGEARRRTMPVDALPPNAFGLHHVHGNVEEWCRDAFAEAYATSLRRKDPVWTRGGDTRVLRGGSWRAAATDCRSAARSGDRRIARRDYRGLRAVFEPDTVDR